MSLQGDAPVSGPASFVWALHHAAALSCAISSRSGGSVHTLCRGRWPVTDAFVEHEARPDEDACCGGCLRVAIDRVERGLAELRDYQSTEASSK